MEGATALILIHGDRAYADAAAEAARRLIGEAAMPRLRRPATARTRRRRRTETMPGELLPRAAGEGDRVAVEGARRGLITRRGQPRGWSRTHTAVLGHRARCEPKCAEPGCPDSSQPCACAARRAECARARYVRFRSISTASRNSAQKKSRIYGPIGCWRRKRSPSSRLPRRPCQTITLGRCHLPPCGAGSSDCQRRCAHDARIMFVVCSGEASWRRPLPATRSPFTATRSPSPASRGRKSRGSLRVLADRNRVCASFNTRSRPSACPLSAGTLNDTRPAAWSNLSCFPAEPLLDRAHLALRPLIETSTSLSVIRSWMGWT